MEGTGYENGLHAFGNDGNDEAAEGVEEYSAQELCEEWLCNDVTPGSNSDCPDGPDTGRASSAEVENSDGDSSSEEEDDYSSSEEEKQDNNSETEESTEESNSESEESTEENTVVLIVYDWDDTLLPYDTIAPHFSIQFFR